MGKTPISAWQAAPVRDNKKAPNGGRAPWVVALVALVVSIYIMPESGAAFAPIDNRIAKVGEAWLFKSVPVVNRPVDIDQSLVANPLSHLSPSQLSSCDYMSEAILAGTQGHKCLDAESCLLGESKIVDECLLGRKKRHIIEHMNIISGRLARIQNYWPKFKFEISRGSLSKTLANGSSQIGPQLAFARPLCLTYLADNRKDQQKIYNEDSASQPNNGIINHLIDDPRKGVVVSYLVGAFCGAIGVAIYLKGRSLIGGTLIALGLFTPLLPWWLPILNWRVHQ